MHKLFGFILFFVYFNVFASEKQINEYFFKQSINAESCYKTSISVRNFSSVWIKRTDLKKEDIDWTINELHEISHDGGNILFKGYFDTDTMKITKLKTEKCGEEKITWGAFFYSEKQHKGLCNNVEINDMMYTEAVKIENYDKANLLNLKPSSKFDDAKFIMMAPMELIKMSKSINQECLFEKRRNKGFFERD